MTLGVGAEVVARIETARASGLDVTADMYPWIASANGLAATIPDWARAGGVDAMIRRLNGEGGEGVYERILGEIRSSDFHPEDILILSIVNPALKPFVGKRLDEVAKEMAGVEGPPDPAGRGGRPGPG